MKQRCKMLRMRPKTEGDRETRNFGFEVKEEPNL